MDLTPENKTFETTTASRPIFVNMLALLIIVISGCILVVLIVMAWVEMCPTGQCQAFTSVKELISILLPLIGTWVGTVLAFYFSKDNFEAANNQVQQMVKQINIQGDGLRSIKASEVMTKMDTAVLMLAKGENDFQEKLIADVLNKLKETNSERLPVLEETSLKLIFLIYRTTIERFLLGVTDSSVKPNRVSFTVSDLKIKDMFESDFQLMKDIEKCQAGFVPLGATLEQVKDRLSGNGVCQDVFVTQTGSKDETVLGWITNNMIIEKSELFKRPKSGQ